MTSPESAAHLAPQGSAPSVERRDMSFVSGGVRCAAWFYPAQSTEEQPPLVVLGHGLGGTRHMRLDQYAQRFVRAGMSALVFDYRGFGDSDGAPRQIVDVRKQVEDWHAALAFARAELPIDAQRIAIWGTSFGGGHVMRVGAEDQALAAVVAQCPFTDGVSSVLRRFLTFPPSAAVLFAAAIVDAFLALVRRPPLLMPMAGTRWMPAFLASQDSLGGAADQAESGTLVAARASRWLRRLPSVRRRIGDHLELSDREVPKELDSMWGVLISPSGALMVNAIAARLALTLATYRPGRSLRRIRSARVLVCACDGDTVAPVGPTVRAARGLANVEVIRYPYGHFEIYVGDAFEHAVADQLGFLSKTLHPEPIAA